MKIYKVLRLLMISWVLLPQLSLGQESTPEVIRRAMNDELERSMSELVNEDGDQPFFISYTVTDSYYFSTSASLGAVVQSVDMPGRNGGVRVMVGDYDFNDESMSLFNNYLDEPQAAVGSIDMPIDKDYYGIRRSLWTSTDAIFKSAAAAFKKNKAYLKEHEDDEDLTYRRFVKTPVTTNIIESKQTEVDKPKLIKLAKDLSRLFKENGDYQNSLVSISYVDNINYFLNSEGSTYQIPSKVAVVMIFAQTELESGEPLLEQTIKYYDHPQDIPDFDILKSEVDRLKQRIEMVKSAEALKESYSGPVLFLDEAVAEVFSQSLFGMEESLVDSKPINVRDNSDYGSRLGDLSSKIDKKVTSSLLTVKATPKRKSYNGTPLFGTFIVDKEGVEPADELLLVENGVLRNLLNDRTTSSTTHIPNGHSISGGNAGPGVIEITSDITESVDTMKKKLIDMASAEGLEYAVIIREMPLNGYFNTLNFYRVSLEDGTEEFMKSANLGSITLKSLKDIVGMSGDQKAYNLSPTAIGFGGSPLSIIAPSALLITDVDLDTSESRFYNKSDILVPNPLND